MSSREESYVNYEEENFLKYGKFLSHPPPGEEVCITGISGCFPNAANVEEFKEKLFNKIDMIQDDIRWGMHNPEIPKRVGATTAIDKFDSGFFGISGNQAKYMCVLVRLSLERAIEAICDAGVNPKELEGTRTGVYVGTCNSESENLWYQIRVESGSAVTGCMRSMISNRISYYLKLIGPSMIMDTACSSSAMAIDTAYQHMREGRIDNAIICGSMVSLHPYTNLQFARLGVLSKDGKCKVFDQCGDGYARSEAVTSLFLQKTKNAKRMYATLIHSKINSDGYKEQGITYPSKIGQKTLLEEFYKECQVDPSTLSYFEAHGTGTKVGDPEEANGIDEVCTENRTTPLLIGSVKSNIGHTEPSSGVCSVIKCIIATESGLIPPNINFTAPREDIPGIVEGRMKVVTELTPFQDDRGLIGISNFGFGGSNSHILIKWNPKTNANKSLTSEDLPRLVCIGSRTKEGVESFLDEVKTTLDVEYIGLLHELFKNEIPNLSYRGFTIISNEKEFVRSVKHIGNPKPLYLVFGGYEDNWKTVAQQFLKVANFKETIQKVQNIVQPLNINIDDIISAERNSVFENIFGSIVVKLGIVAILKNIKLNPEGIIGYSLGELICAYFDNSLTLEEVVLAACSVAKYVEKVDQASQADNVSLLKPNLVQDLSKILKNPKPLSDLHIFGRNSLASADFFINSLTNVTNLKDFLAQIDIESVVYEIGHGCLNNSLIDPENQHRINIFINSIDDSYLIGFLSNLGSLFEHGHQLTISKLYPEISFPVSRGTPFISPKIKWNHTYTWETVSFRELQFLKVGAKKYELNFDKNGNWNFAHGHVIDGRNLFPATGYLKLVWDTYCSTEGFDLRQYEIVFENCKFHRAVNCVKEGNLEMIVMVQRNTGNFEIIEGDQAVVTGRIRYKSGREKQMKVHQSDIEDNASLPLKTKDIYKELRLRGYNYSGLFRGLLEVNGKLNKAKVKWSNNWVAFLDNLLQVKILELDSRLLYVPTGIRRIIINPKKHFEIINENGTEEESELKAFICPESGVIKCGGVQVEGLGASSIIRRKPLGEPVLEKYIFVPNEAELSLECSARVNMQILLENNMEYKVKVVEVRDEENIDGQPLGPIIHQVLGDQPVIQAEVTVLSKTPLELENVTVESGKLEQYSECSVVVINKGLSRKDLVQRVFNSIKPNGFIISRENLDTPIKRLDNFELEILTAHKTNKELVLLLRKTVDYQRAVAVDVQNQNQQCNWVSKLQKSIGQGGNVIVHALNEPQSGILGLVNCIRREPGSGTVRCVFTTEEVPEFDQFNPFYYHQLKKNMAVNVYKNGTWGTYRHLALEDNAQVLTEHKYLNVAVKGDLSSLTWFEGPLHSKSEIAPESTLIHTYYTALNFRDVMTATNKISADVITQYRPAQDNVIGFEFAGRLTSGKRVGGLLLFGGFSSVSIADSYLLFEVPEEWSMADAATIPVVYLTVVYALFSRTTIKKGDKVLIHSGTGGVGLAAIQLALHVGCQVFTTVSTEEKRNFIKKRFPQLTDKNIGNSRDTSFEQLIMEQTEGYGVDVVLNSLSDDKLQASIRCLAYGGRFMEIGKFDLANDSRINLLNLEKEQSFHGVMLDGLLGGSPMLKKQLSHCLNGFIKCGAVRPLPKTVFKDDEAEKAFRYMTTGKHIGKVLIQLRKEEKEMVVVPRVALYKAVPRYFCNPDNSYIIAGGLGGFGLELADWLVIRGARKIVLNSRSGLRTGYQNLRINIWKSYGTDVMISTADITTKEGCEELLKTANELGPVEAIFNLAVVLKDSILENQTSDTFRDSYRPKALATKYLDEISRRLCPKLKDFVVFSSVSCGRGNAGQTNYGHSNSVMERICEKRKSEGLPALAIQWGAIGEVGLVADMQEENTEIEIGGTLQQRISSCLQVMDKLLRCPEPIVSSMVVAEKRAGAGGADNIIDAVAYILGIKDMKAVSYHASLAELGMDSMTAVEIKQTLEREFDVFLTAQDIRSMTLSRLQEIQDERSQSEAPEPTAEKIEVNFFTELFKIIGDEQTVNVPLLKMTSKVRDNEAAPKVVFYPGIEGVADMMASLAMNLDAHVLAVQYCPDGHGDTVREMAEKTVPYVLDCLTKQQHFTIVAHSFGVPVALEAVSLLEEAGYGGTVICIDGSPNNLRILSGMINTNSATNWETSLMVHFLSQATSTEVAEKNKAILASCASMEERISVMEQVVGLQSRYSCEHIKSLTESSFKRIHAVNTYSLKKLPLKSKVILLRPTVQSVVGLSEDYGLSEMVGQTVDVHVFEADHVSILSHADVAKLINDLVNITQTFVKESIVKVNEFVKVRSETSI